MKALSSATAAALGRRLETLMERRGAAGLQYLMLRHGTIAFEYCAGIADAHTGTPVTPETVFNAYSITKPFTAAAAATLDAMGLLRLDAPIGKAAGVDQIEAYGSLRDALLHRAGFRNPYPLRWIHPAEGHSSFDESAFVNAQVARVQRARPLRSSRYSNVGYLLAGMAVERAQRSRFSRATESLVFEPLGLRDDETLGFGFPAPKHWAHGHLRRKGLLNLALGVLVGRGIVESVEGRWVRLKLHNVNGSAYGGLLANARGLGRFCSAILGEAQGVALATRERLLTLVDGCRPERSVGFFSGKLAGSRWFGHPGGGLGGYGEIRVYPELRAVSVLLTNAPGLANANCLDDIDWHWIQQ